MESFGAFWALLFTVQLPVLHAKNWYFWAWKTCSNYMQCTAALQACRKAKGKISLLATLKLKQFCME